MQNQNRIGNQTPRIDLYIPGSNDKLELFYEFLNEYGVSPLEWQKLVLKRWTSEDKNGKLSNPICGLSAPRQVGKSELIKMRILYGLIFRQCRGLYTAQKQTTVDEMVAKVQDFFYNGPEEIFNLLTDRFRSKPKNFKYIELQLPSGKTARYDFLTRTRLGGLGLTFDENIHDEAADMYDAHLETLQPTLSAAKGRSPQTIFAGTPPMAETVGEVFARTRRKILAGEKGSWIEFGVETFTDPHDVDAWYEANPSLGLTLLESAVRAESVSLSADGFNRMRLGWWAGVEDKRAIPETWWEACKTEKPVFDEDYKPVYAIKFAPDRSMYSLVVAMPLKGEERIHVEIVLARPMNEGFTKLVQWLIKPPQGRPARWTKAEKIIIDGATGAPILLEELTHAGVPLKRILQPNMKQIGAAHAFMLDAIKQGQLSHYDQPLLNQTVRVTKQRQLGRYGGFGWDSMSKELSTCALDAATYAYWGQRVFGKKRSELDAEANAQKWRDVFAKL